MIRYAILLTLLACPAFADTGREPVIVCRPEYPSGEPDIFSTTLPVTLWAGEATGMRFTDLPQPPRPRPLWIDGGSTGPKRPVDPAPSPVPLPGAGSLIGVGIAALAVLGGIRRWA